MDIYEQALAAHKQSKGKIYTGLRGEVTKDTLKLYYSPGVGGVALYAKDDAAKLKEVSWTNNLVAIISDGSAVLGLGDIGPLGAMPVMEGKAMLFKHFANIDAVPIVLNVHSVDEIVAAVRAIAPSFGGINLEDIAAPKCFEIEERLKAELDIPIMHDDQHGTAIVVLAGLINSLKLLGNYSIQELRITIVGSGAAGTAIANLLALYGASDIVMVDSKGIIGPKRTDLNDEKKKLLKFNTLGRDGSLEDAVAGSHVFVGVSKAGLLTPTMIKTMQPKPVIFALANPEPEIMPDVAKEAGAFIVATGRSDFPNQVNNSLGFPGIFRGALDNGVTKISDQHKIAAAEALAALVQEPTVDKIIPGPFDEGVVTAVANVIR
ncbi:NADP-dependent malic enzyme [bacterium]|nr:NADP-dependent malic enzyme [bacterium]NBX98441.1 NADP-dependent malic enzyme [bacterium]NDC94117.1 NADP-dependent malic enzyme [bacterium]NDD83342.1 NADP-dependent malic enzyme [bacterium]NDG28920.1 NADP-dependent malic enzyme [bacterium]